MNGTPVVFNRKYVSFNMPQENPKGLSIWRNKKRKMETDLDHSGVFLIDFIMSLVSSNETTVESFR